VAWHNIAAGSLTASPGRTCNEAMTRVLIGTMPFPSHVSPILPIARELCRRGHDVLWYTGEKSRAAVERTGAELVPTRPEFDYDIDELNRRHPERVAATGLAAAKWMVKNVFIGAATAQVEDIRRALARFPADVLLTSTVFMGGPLLHELTGLPWASVNYFPLPVRSRDTAPFGMGLKPSATPLGRMRNRVLDEVFRRYLYRDVLVRLNEVRAPFGLPPVPEVTFGASPYLFLQATGESFEYPRSDLPEQVRFVGPLLPDPPDRFDPPPWWPELFSGRPVVLVTQGTVANVDIDELIGPTVEALAGEDVLVVATTGRDGAWPPDRPLPANVRLEPFVSYRHLMPHVSVLVTNGGYGSVQLALDDGVPLVVSGRTEEKPEICGRVAWTGAGVDLRSRRPSPDQVRGAVRSVLADPGYRARAQGIQADFRRHDAVRESADLLERLAETAAPVHPL
jgi:MGT family glycosyltransferase